MACSMSEKENDVLRFAKEEKNNELHFHKTAAVAALWN
jgi:hypothetical protein